MQFEIDSDLLSALPKKNVTAINLVSVIEQQIGSVWLLSILIVNVVSQPTIFLCMIRACMYRILRRSHPSPNILQDTSDHKWKRSSGGIMARQHGGSDEKVSKRREKVRWTIPTQQCNDQTSLAEKWKAKSGYHSNFDVARETWTRLPSHAGNLCAANQPFTYYNSYSPFGHMRRNASICTHLS